MYKNVCKKLMKLEEDIKSGNVVSLENFWINISKMGAPIIEKIDGDDENVNITFVYRAKDIKNVLIYGHAFGFNHCTNVFLRFLDTDIWYKTYKLRNDIRFSYSFSVNDELTEDEDARYENLIPDPYNNKRFIYKANNENPEDVERNASLVELSNVEPQKWGCERKNVDKGNLNVHRIYSNKLNNERRVWVYTPPHYSPNDEPYGVLVLTDGFDYINTVSIPTIMDNLLSDNKIPPIVVIFIDSNQNRMNELMCNPLFADFVVYEVMPFVNKLYNVTNEPNKKIIGGFSLGGLTAAYIGLTHSNTFGNVISQSGSYFWKPKSDDEYQWLIREYQISKKLQLKFFITVGVLENRETVSGISMIELSKIFRDTLTSKGYYVYFEEFKSGHDWLCNGETLAHGLIQLLTNSLN